MQQTKFTLRDIERLKLIPYKYSSLLKFCKEGRLEHSRAGKSANSRIVVTRESINKFNEKSFKDTRNSL